MQNRSIFPYRRHGPKKRVKHGPNRQPRGPQKGLPNSARDLLPMLQPATKALAQVLAGRAGVSGQLGHARTMLAQAERMIAERAHNRLTPSEREEFIEQLARLKLTLADADAEAEVQAVEQHEPRPQAAPVAQERLKEMALALSVRERPGRSGAQAEPATSEAGAPEAGPASAHEATPRPGAEPVEDQAQAASEPAREPEAGARAGEPGAAARGGRLMLPKGGADQAVQALAIGGLARRRSRAMSWAAAASAADAAGRPTAAPPAAAGEADPPSRTATPEPDRDDPSGAAGGEQHGADRPEGAGEAHGGNGASETTPRARAAARRGRKAKQQGLPEGWVIDEEGFVVPGAG
jgi:hypothetical protein